MQSPILGGSYVARSVNAADNVMINLFPEVTPEGGKTEGFLQRAPGLRQFTATGSGPIRGMITNGEEAFIVSGNELYRRPIAGPNYLVGAVTGTGPVSMADNGTQIFIACNPDGFIYNYVTAAFAQVTDIDFPGAVTVGFIDGYFVFNPPDSQEVWVTSILDGTNIPGDFASAEGSPDNLISLIVDHREIWLFGTNSIEVWYNAGTAGFPLARIDGAFNEIGCAAPYSVAKLDNGIFWLGADSRGSGIVYRANGYTGQRISTHAVEQAIQRYTLTSDAVAYTYQQDGHAFYVLNFPSAQTTWVFDVATGVWHERRSFRNGQFDRHRGNCQMFFDGQVIVGDYASSQLYVLDLETYTDFANPLDAQKWVRSWRALPPGTNNLKRQAHHGLQLDCEAGVGTSPAVSVQGSDPQVMLRWSDDGGHTWSNEHWTAMGKIGEYGRRAIWRRLGMTTKLRDRVYEVSGTDPVKIAIMGAELIVSPTGS